jgi:hypothetical protein
MFDSPPFWILVNSMLPRLDLGTTALVSSQIAVAQDNPIAEPASWIALAYISLTLTRYLISLEDSLHNLQPTPFFQLAALLPLHS